MNNEIETELEPEIKTQRIPQSIPKMRLDQQHLVITEIFYSLQGESSLMGLPFAFIRLTGCNLRCVYCDSAYAFRDGKRLRISEVVDTIKPFQVKQVLVTGGEPLLQRNTPILIQALSDLGYQVSIETHGEISIQAVSEHARIIMDIKTPSSGMCKRGFYRNLPFLKKHRDEVKFVIASKEDYFWAKDLVLQNLIPTEEILFSAANPALHSPGNFEPVSATWLAESILRDHLRVRIQLQLHKILWGMDRKGV